MKGGDLGADAAFRKILSIGYEFECSDLAKLSLHSKKKTLINSDLALRQMSLLMNRKTVKPVSDPHYLHVRIPINKKHGQAPALTQEEVDEEDEFLREFREEFPEEYEADQKETALAKKENESYLEYFYENRKSDNKETIKFQITNDLADTDFNLMLKEKCKGLNIPKNDMYFFKTEKGKVYDIKFSEDIATNEYCDSFSSVEFVVTYYRPKQDFPNVIIDTFVDACSRIVDHMANLTKTKGELLMHDNSKTHYQPTSYLGNMRHLFHKPGTNLYYMDTYDDNDVSELQTLGDAIMAPQMTFRSKAEDSLSIMKEILRIHGKVKKGKSAAKNVDYEMQTLLFVEEQVDKLIAAHNTSSEKHIVLTSEIGKTLKIYLFLMFYKLNMLIVNHVDIFSKASYLKDYLTFSSRHSNEVLYERSKVIMKQHYGINNIADFLNKPSIIESFYEREYGDEDQGDDFDEEGNYKFNYDAHTSDLPENDPNFGNPLFSMVSYFKRLEKGEDWLKESGWDVFSTNFDLKNDEVLLENRFFMYEINLFLKNHVKGSFRERDLTLHNLASIVNHFYGTKMKKMMTLTAHPSKGTLTSRASLQKQRFSAKIGPNSKYIRPVSKFKSATISKRPSSSNKTAKRTDRLSAIKEGAE
uniref:Uncharacterized protein n=1 Tax=viral metagenome TaxID=1070528 RepID=A0A6C0B923_9ZZZZ